jgi:hypothetical protein
VAFSEYSNVVQRDQAFGAGYRSIYEHYREEAEYNRELMKKDDQDLNTTLIFVSFLWLSGVCILTQAQAGLFSAITSTFIIEVNSKLTPNPNGETTVLFRVLIYKTDNTTLGGGRPTLPPWKGPPRTVAHVQAILFANLAASLLSAFLTMLGKRRLNRHASIDMQGLAVECNQNRQRKLDGIVTWYFDYVVESTVDAAGYTAASRLRPLPLSLGDQRHRCILRPQCNIV